MEPFWTMSSETMQIHCINSKYSCKSSTCPTWAPKLPLHTLHLKGNGRPLRNICSAGQSHACSSVHTGLSCLLKACPAISAPGHMYPPA